MGATDTRDAVPDVAPVPVRAGRSRRAVGLLVAAVLVVAVMALLQRSSGAPRFDAEDVRVADTTPAALPAFQPLAEVDRQIAVYEERVAADPDSATELRLLGGLYLDRAGATGDLRSYVQAQEALDRALAIYPGDINSAVLLTRVRLALHDFAGALTLSEQVLLADPGRFDALASSTDALLALGRYDDARRRLGQLAELAPEDPSQLVRSAEFARLEGDTARALELVRAAADAVAPTRRRAAGFFHAFAAQLAFDVGALDVAARDAAVALDRDPDSPEVLATAARVAAATGDLDLAVERYEAAVAIVPVPEYLAELGDVLALLGDERGAAANYGTIEAIAQLSQGVYDRGLALYWADHDLEPERAVAATEAELAQRRDVEGLDAHAWTLLKAGRAEEARVVADEAAALLGHRTPVMLHHAGMISAALGDTDRAIEELEASLAANPGWSPLQADIAARTLSGLREGGA